MNLLLVIATFLIQQTYVKTQTGNGLDYNASVEQAKRQMKYFLARDVPVKASLNTLEDYYIDHEERDLPLQSRYMETVRRPCKVLPDPDPGLVNRRLVEPVHRYRPLFKSEKFYGKFALPIKYEISKDRPPIVGAAPLPPISRVYNSNPFDGYQGNYDASNEYFQTEIEYFSSKITNSYAYTEPYVITETFSPTKTSSINPTSWVSNLSIDYSLRLASMSSVLSSNSAAMASMSFSVKIASMSSVFAQKEASLRSKLCQHSATATANKAGWHW